MPSKKSLLVNIKKSYVISQDRMYTYITLYRMIELEIVKDQEDDSDMKEKVNKIRIKVTEGEEIKEMIENHDSNKQ